VGGVSARARDLLRLALAYLLVFALALLAFEGLSRLRKHRFPGIAPQGVGDRGLWVYDRTKGWFHAPGSGGRSFLGGPDPGSVRINSLGLRGRELSLTKPRGVTRVLVFGDSFAFGVGVDEPHLFSSVLEQLLQRADPTHPYEVVNLGVSGYSTDQELILLQELGPRLAPDFILLVACDNDFEGNTQDFIYQRYYKPFFALDEGGGLGLRNVPVPTLTRLQQGKLWLGQHSNAWNLLRSRRARSERLQKLFDWFQVDVVRSPAQDPILLMYALTHAFRATAEGLGAVFLTFNTGHRGENTPLFQALRPLLIREGMRFLGLEGTLGEARRREPARQWDFPQDSHWNVDSHRLAARVVFNYLRALDRGEPARDTASR